MELGGIARIGIGIELPLGLGTGVGIGVELPLSESELALEWNYKNGIDRSFATNCARIRRSPLSMTRAKRA